MQDNATASLTDVCYKPFGAECATQSLLQYWQMNRTIYEQGFPPHHTKLTPEFCFGHWSTQVHTSRPLRLLSAMAIQRRTWLHANAKTVIPVLSFVMIYMRCRTCWDLQAAALCTCHVKLLLKCLLLPQCRAAFGGPIDPHLVLGGFPADASFRSYTADATSFIVTYPLDSSPDSKCAACTMTPALTALSSNVILHLQSCW